MTKKNQGFTLIELLVVIAILSILFALVAVMGANMMEKARVQQTRGTVMTLVSACEQYHKVFGGLYPDVAQPMNFTNPAYLGNTSAISIASGDFTEDQFKEFNKRLRFLLADRSFVIDEISHGPFLDDAIPKIQDEADTSENTDMFVDAWGEFIRICPGRNHTTDNPVGPNNVHPQRALATGPGFNATIGANSFRAFFLLDIYSVGSNGEDNCGTNKLQTTLDTTVEEGDDITSWFIQKAK